MSEINKFEAYKKKLQGVCDENELVFRFKNDSYPITLTVRPVNGNEQMSLLDDGDKEKVNPNHALTFAYKDGVLTYKIAEGFAIDDALFNKLKNLYKNMHSLWLQFFNREVIEKQLLTGDKLPKASEEDPADNTDDDLDDPEELDDPDDPEDGDDLNDDDDGDGAGEDDEPPQENVTPLRRGRKKAQ